MRNVLSLLQPPLVSPYHTLCLCIRRTTPCFGHKLSKVQAYHCIWHDQSNAWAAQPRS